MRFTTKAFATSTITAFGALGAAVALGPTAAAAPAPAPADPGGPPAPPGVEQLANLPAVAPQVMQGVASALQSTPQQPAASQTPGASAQITMPQTPANAPQQSSLIPGASPAATAPAATYPARTAPAATTPAAGNTNSVVPTAEVPIPDVPGLPVPLPQTVSFPEDVTSLIPASMPGSDLAKGATPSAPAAPAAPAAAAPTAATAPVMFPTSGLP